MTDGKIITNRMKYPVRAARIFAKLTKKELAKRLRLSPSKYERLEKRTQKIKLRTFIRVLLACNLTIDFIWPEQ